jgi:hypothetical protein
VENLNAYTQSYLIKTDNNLFSNANKNISKKNDDVERETPLSDIKNYLKTQERYRRPLEFYYREDISPRKIYSYYIDEKYIHVRAKSGRDIKFLIDKIRKL